MKNNKIDVQLEYLEKINQRSDEFRRINESRDPLDRLAKLFCELRETSSEDSFDIEIHKKIKSLFKDAVLKIISDREDFLINPGD